MHIFKKFQHNFRRITFAFFTISHIIFIYIVVIKLLRKLIISVCKKSSFRNNNNLQKYDNLFKLFFYVLTRSYQNVYNFA